MHSATGPWPVLLSSWSLKHALQAASPPCGQVAACGCPNVRAPTRADTEHCTRRRRGHSSGARSFTPRSGRRPDHWDRKQAQQSVTRIRSLTSLIVRRCAFGPRASPLGRVRCTQRHALRDRPLACTLEQWLTGIPLQRRLCRPADKSQPAAAPMSAPQRMPPPSVVHQVGVGTLLGRGVSLRGPVATFRSYRPEPTRMSAVHNSQNAGKCSTLHRRYPVTSVDRALSTVPCTPR